MSKAVDVHLVRAIADIAIFLEFTNEELLNPDTAIEAMEQLASELQGMPESVQREFSRELKTLADSYGVQKNFVATLPQALGILE
jgi:hypothetical protein